MIHAYWVTFTHAPSGCVEDETIEKATEQARDYGRVVTVARLPYPADPRLTPKERQGPCPSFCYQPTKCAGSGSCPQRYACSE